MVCAPLANLSKVLLRNLLQLHLICSIHLKKVNHHHQVSPMVKIVQATCSNGELVLSEKLNPELEGKTVQIMIFELSESSETMDSREPKIKEFLAQVKNYSFKIPSDYKFDREEIYNK